MYRKTFASADAATMAKGVNSANAPSHVKTAGTALDTIVAAALITFADTNVKSQS